MDAPFLAKDQTEVVRGSFTYIDPDAYGEEKPYYSSGPLAASEERLRIAHQIAPYQIATKSLPPNRYLPSRYLIAPTKLLPI